MLRFAHAADIHLDSPLRGLVTYEGAPPAALFRSATRRAFDNLVDWLLDTDIPLLLIAGDLYDGDWTDFNTGLYLVRRMAQLGEKGIRVGIVRGNHDAASQMTRSLVMPPNVKIFDAQRPETWLLPELGVAVHGQSYADREVAANLAEAYPDPVPGLFNVGLLHGLVSGSQGHAVYAPCTRVQLAAKGYDYWALGHVHRAAVLQSQPAIVYAGCLQGRHIRENGAKGCFKVTVADGNLRTEFVPLDVLRWLEIQIDVSAAADFESVAQHFGDALAERLPALDGRPSGIRTVLTGRSPVHGMLLSYPETLDANIRAAAAALAGDQVWIESVRIQTGPELDFALLAASDTPQGEMLRLLQSMARSPDGLLDTALDLSDVRAKLAEAGLEVETEDPALLLADARDILLTLLAEASPPEPAE